MTGPSILSTPAAERFGGQQELEQKAQAAASRRAGVQAVEACSAGQAATVQTGTACEDRDAEAEVGSEAGQNSKSHQSSEGIACGLGRGPL